MFVKIYWLFLHLGLMTVTAAFIMGSRLDVLASSGNVKFNVILYVIFIMVHILMTMPFFKRVLFGSPQGRLFERQIYISTSIVTWLAVYVLHRPVPGIGLTSPFWLQFVGLCAVLLSLFVFSNSQTSRSRAAC